MIRTAAALFRQRGYSGVGLAELLAASEAPKGSFYHHFPEGKEQLGEAAVRYAGDGVGRTIDGAYETAADFGSGTRALVGQIAGWLERSGFREGCPITSVLLDTVPQSAAISMAVRDVFEDWERRLAGHAQRFGQFGFEPVDSRRLLVLIEGAWIVARAYRSTAPMHDAAETFLRDMASRDPSLANRDP